MKISSESIPVLEEINIEDVEALALANGVVQRYSDKEILFRDFAIREREDATRHDRETVSNATLREEMDAGLASERNSAHHSTMNELRATFNSFKKSPDGFYGTVRILALAEELREKLKSAAA